MLKPVEFSMGCDPEIFLKGNGRIIGSERIVPKEGISPITGQKPFIVRDGVQVELNFPPAMNVRALGRLIRDAFIALNNLLWQHQGVSVCWDGVVEVEREELDSLSPESRMFGCMPSRNRWGTRPINVDPNVYLKRSAGGHLHIGLLGFQPALYSTNPWNDNRDDVIPYFDALVANTCVLIDQDPGAAERRQNYGRAGENRQPEYGFEYRTLSNFWLRNYSLTDLVFGLANLAVATALDPKAEEDLLTLIDGDFTPYVEAINENSWIKAFDNFHRLIPFFTAHSSHAFPIDGLNMGLFLKFLQDIRTCGIDVMFFQDPIQHWVSGSKQTFREYLHG